MPTPATSPELLLRVGGVQRVLQLATERLQLLAQVAALLLRLGPGHALGLQVLLGLSQACLRLPQGLEQLGPGPALLLCPGGDKDGEVAQGRQGCGMVSGDGEARSLGLESGQSRVQTPALPWARDSGPWASQVTLAESLPHAHPLLHCLLECCGQRRKLRPEGEGTVQARAQQEGPS